MGIKQKQIVGVLSIVLLSLTSLTLSSQISHSASLATLPATQQAFETSIPITLTALSSSVPNQPIITPTPNDQCPTSTSAATPSAKVGFDFETGIECWNASEENFKLVHLDISNLLAHSGNSSLEVDMELFGNKSTQTLKPDNKDKVDVYQHTEITAYLDRAIPEGYQTPGPYDLTGKKISCFVYLPSQLTNAGRPWPYIRIFAKDAGFANLFGDALDIDKTQVNKWVELSLNIKNDGDFDATQMNTIGIRIDTQAGSKLSYIGPIYIDDCTIS